MPFRAKTAVGLVAVAAVSLAVALSLTVFGSDAVPSHGADTFSRSALGHRAFVEFLRRRGIPVVVSRHASAARARDAALLVVAEPRVVTQAQPRAAGEGDRADRDLEWRLSRMASEASRMLLVLPKWQGEPDPGRRDFVGSAGLRPAAEPERVLRAAGLDAELVRLDSSGSLGCDGPAAPALTRPQLLRPGAGGLQPVIACGDAVLLAERAVGPLRTFVLSDPDLLSNHGLGRGDNAALLAWILDLVRDSSAQAVIVDETLHGYDSAPSLARELLRYPLALAVLQGTLAVAVLVWAGVRRFGPPFPVPPALAPGKGLLIENTALLLRLGGFSAHTLGRYFEAVLHEVARGLRAPAVADPARLRSGLEEAGRRRRVSVGLAALESRVRELRDKPAPPGAVVAAARRIHRWKEEMLSHGHPGDPRR